MTPRDGETQYIDGEPIGTIHLHARSGCWFHKRNRVVGPARFENAEEAADALRKVATS